MRKADPTLHETRRAQVLRAALACFRRKGFAATTTAEICREAGMSAGHLFHYFRSKEEIVAAVAQTDRVQANAAVAALAEAPDFVDALIGASGADVDIGEYALDGRLALELHGEAARSEGVAQALRDNYRALQGSLRSALAAAQARGTVDSTLDPIGAAILITALFEGIERAAACDPELDQGAAGASMAVLLRRYLAPQGDIKEVSADLLGPKIRTRRGAGPAP